jgi:hypothetical protein
MPDSPPPEERERLDKEAKEKEAAEQAELPYQWTQTIKDVDVTIAIPANIKGRDLDVVLAKSKLKVAIKGQPPFIDVGVWFLNTDLVTLISRRANSLIPSSRTNPPGR